MRRRRKQFTRALSTRNTDKAYISAAAARQQHSHGERGRVAYRAYENDGVE